MNRIPKYISLKSQDNVYKQCCDSLPKVFGLTQSKKVVSGILVMKRMTIAGEQEKRRQSVLELFCLPRTLDTINCDALWP